MAKDRSPNYPAHDLGAALEFIRKVYGKEGKSSADAAVMARHLGYSSLSGSARQKIASMRQYGLVEDAPGGKLRVSKLGVILSHDPNAPGNLALVQEAKLTPKLFRELYEKHPDASDTNLEVRLINDNGFTPEGARRVIKAYRETMAFAKPLPAGYNGPNGEANGESEVPSTEEHQEHKGRRGSGDGHEGASDVTYSWPLDDAEKVEVAFIGSPGKKPSQRDLEAVIDYLELVRKRTMESDNDKKGGE